MRLTGCASPGTATNGAAVMRTGSSPPRRAAISMQDSPARDTRAATASLTSLTDSAPVKMPLNAAASRSSTSPSSSDSSTCDSLGSSEPSTPP